MLSPDEKTHITEEMELCGFTDVSISDYFDERFVKTVSLVEARFNYPELGVNLVCAAADYTPSPIRTEDFLRRVLHIVHERAIGGNRHGRID